MTSHSENSNIFKDDDVLEALRSPSKANRNKRSKGHYYATSLEGSFSAMLKFLYVLSILFTLLAGFQMNMFMHFSSILFLGIILALQVTLSTVIYILLKYFVANCQANIELNRKQSE